MGGTVFGVEYSVEEGDLFAAQADAIVNPWNRNFVPRWMMKPGGVSGRLKQLTGPGPWDELAVHGLLELGEAVVTDAGTYGNVKWIVHAAGLNVLWKASAASVRESTANSVYAARAIGARTLVMPLIGSGSGGLDPAVSLNTITGVLDSFAAPERTDLTVRVITPARAAAAA